MEPSRASSHAASRSASDRRLLRRRYRGHDVHRPTMDIFANGVERRPATRGSYAMSPRRIGLYCEFSECLAQFRGNTVIYSFSACKWQLCQLHFCLYSRKLWLCDLYGELVLLPSHNCVQLFGNARKIPINIYWQKATPRLIVWQRGFNLISCSRWLHKFNTEQLN